jgi:hypothetical protein
MDKPTDSTIGYIGIERTLTVSVGETRTAKQNIARIVPVKVRSIETSDEYILPVEEIVLGNFDEVRGVTSVPTPAVDVLIPRLDEPEGLEFAFESVQTFGLVRTPKSRLVLADLGQDEEIKLPLDSALVGVVPAPPGTFAVTIYDTRTDQDSKLGYHFNGTPQRNWVEIALHKRESILNERRRIQREKEEERRQIAERAQQETKAAQKREADAKKPIERFETADREVAARIREAYFSRIIHTSKVAKNISSKIQKATGRKSPMLYRLNASF